VTGLPAGQVSLRTQALARHGFRYRRYLAAPFRALFVRISQKPQAAEHGRTGD